MSNIRRVGVNTVPGTGFSLPSGEGFLERYKTAVQMTPLTRDVGARRELLPALLPGYAGAAVGEVMSKAPGDEIDWVPQAGAGALYELPLYSERPVAEGENCIRIVTAPSPYSTVAGSGLLDGRYTGERSGTAGFTAQDAEFGRTAALRFTPLIDVNLKEVRIGGIAIADFPSGDGVVYPADAAGRQMAASLTSLRVVVINEGNGQAIFDSHGILESWSGNYKGANASLGWFGEPGTASARGHFAYTQSTGYQLSAGQSYRVVLWTYFYIDGGLALYHPGDVVITGATGVTFYERSGDLTVDARLAPFAPGDASAMLPLIEIGGLLPQPLAAVAVGPAFMQQGSNVHKYAQAVYSQGHGQHVWPTSAALGGEMLDAQGFSVGPAATGGAQRFTARPGSIMGDRRRPALSSTHGHPDTLADPADAGVDAPDAQALLFYLEVQQPTPLWGLRLSPALLATLRGFAGGASRTVTTTLHDVTVIAASPSAGVSTADGAVLIQPRIYGRPLLDDVREARALGLSAPAGQAVDMPMRAIHWLQPTRRYLLSFGTEGALGDDVGLPAKTSPQVGSALGVKTLTGRVSVPQWQAGGYPAMLTLDGSAFTGNPVTLLLGGADKDVLGPSDPADFAVVISDDDLVPGSAGIVEVPGRFPLLRRRQPSGALFTIGGPMSLGPAGFSSVGYVPGGQFPIGDTPQDILFTNELSCAVTIYGIGVAASGPGVDVRIAGTSKPQRPLTWLRAFGDHPSDFPEDNPAFVASHTQIFGLGTRAPLVIEPRETVTISIAANGDTLYGGTSGSLGIHDGSASGPLLLSAPDTAPHEKPVALMYYGLGASDFDNTSGLTSSYQIDGILDYQQMQYGSILRTLALFPRTGSDVFTDLTDLDAGERGLYAPGGGAAPRPVYMDENYEIWYGAPWSKTP